MFSFLKIPAFTLFLSCFLITTALCQSTDLKQVIGVPSTEVYDLLTDSKGFLWIAHSGGVSKYDGISFINYSNPLQKSLSVTGLLEDKYGRIWFNSFGGQIFYIENGRMNLLSAYDGENEPNFPRIGLFKDMLVATTKKGLFMCNIKTLKSHYEICKDFPNKGTSSLSILTDKIIACNNRQWFIYKPDNGLKPAYFNKTDTKLINKNIGKLNVNTFIDTSFLFCNPASVVYKIIVANDSLKILGTIKTEYYINTVTVQSKGYWVNTVKYSIEKPYNNYVRGFDISSLAKDKEGHIWYGSLQKGLITDLESNNPLKNQCVIPLIKNDIIECLIKRDSTLLMGTQDGKLISYNPHSNKATLLLLLPSRQNGISYLKMLEKNELLVGSTTGTFVFNIANRHVEQTYPYMSIKQVDTIEHSIIFATSSGLMICPYKVNINHNNSWKTEFSKQFKGFTEIDGGAFKSWGVEQRTKGVCCVTKYSTIWAAFKNGLYKINKAGIQPFYFDKIQVYASCLTTFEDKVFAGTINNGILIIDNNNIKRLSTNDGLISNNILHIKILNDNLWVYSSGLVQVFNLKTLKIVNKYQLPGMGDALVNDADEINGQCFLANVNGIYKIDSLNNNSSPNIYLSSLIINGRDTNMVTGLKFSHNQNDVQINLAVPSLLNGQNIIVKYRLSNNNYSKWNYSKPGERNFRFELLMPGNYHFEAYASMLQSGIYSSPVKLNFTIMPPWWLRWWAINLAIILGALSIFGVSRLYYINLLAAKTAEYKKKLAVERERQRISSEMHDDLSASLSAIKLYTSTVQYSEDIAVGVSSIYEMISQLSNKITEIIWSLNKVYDTLESLIHFVDLTANKLFEHADIKFKIILPDNIPEIKINSDKRRDILLIVKEALHNILKHSHATDALLEFNIIDKYLIIVIKDNGSGFSIREKGKHIGLGIENMKNRIQKFGGSFLIEAKNGTLITLKMPI